MATSELNATFSAFNGRIGRIVHYNRLGTQCARSYVRPRNPRTPAQCANRSLFRDAVKSWQLLTPEERDSWNLLARKMKRRAKNGYSLFMSRYMKGKDEAILKVKERFQGAAFLCSESNPLRSGPLSTPLHLRIHKRTGNIPLNSWDNTGT